MPTGNPFTTAQAAQTMAPTDYSVEQNQVLRQQQLADLLRKQALEQGGGTEMVSGWAVKKSPLEGLSKIAQAFGSRYLQNQADEKQMALATKLREQGASDMQGVMGAMQGTPEKITDFQPDTFDATDAQNMQQAGAMQNVQPAIAPDRRQAMALALQSQNPMVQGIGARLLEAEMKSPEWVLGERFNKETGMAEKFMYNKNNPTQMQDIGGQKADKVIADNLGGTLTYRGEHSTKPLGTAVKTVTPDAVMTDARTREEGDKNRGVTLRGQGITIRGQNMVDNRSRQTIAQGGGKPMTQAQEAKYRGTVADDWNAANTNLSNMRDVVASVKAVRDAPGLDRATGVMGMVPSIPGLQAAAAEVKMKNLEGKVTQLGKIAAAQGGAVGPMAVQEWKIVRDMIAALEPAKGKDAYLDQTALIEAQVIGAEKRLREAYNNQYSADFERYPQFSKLIEPSEQKPQKNNVVDFGSLK